jgi:mRNA-degrading endonuclease toxin of MazEF toxin-antitoxin module
VVVVQVTFTGQKGSKLRPAVIVSATAFHDGLPDVIICPISSRPIDYARPGPGDHPLAHWQQVGLRHPSTARVSNLVAVEKTLIKRVIGTMPGEDFERIEAGMDFALGL